MWDKKLSCLKTAEQAYSWVGFRHLLPFAWGGAVTNPWHRVVVVTGSLNFKVPEELWPVQPRNRHVDLVVGAFAECQLVFVALALVGFEAVLKLQNFGIPF